MASTDSIVRALTLDFDSLSVIVERPSTVADTPEAVRLTATRGRLVNRQAAQRLQLLEFNRQDTLAYHQVASASSSDHSHAVQAYSPPDGSLVFALLTAILIGLYLLYQFRK